MNKIYTVAELKEMGMDTAQINAVMRAQSENAKQNTSTEEQGILEKQNLSVFKGNEPVQMYQHDVKVTHDISTNALVPTSVSQIATYKRGVIVELPSFADGQPFVARMVRPSMLALVKSGKIPNSLLNQATSLFANGAGALNAGGKNSANVSELFDVIDVIVEAALLEPTLEEIRSVGMELTDDQLMAIFSYTQRGLKALEQFRTE